MALHQLISTIQTLSVTPSSWNQLLGHLKQAENLLQQHQPSLLDVVQSLDPATHSLGSLFILAERGSAPIPPHGNDHFITLVIQFFLAATPEQIQLAPAKVVLLCERFKEHVLARQQPQRAIMTLQTAIHKLAPSTELLTPIHAQLFQVCLLAKCYSAAVPVLSHDIYDVNPARTAMTPRDFLLYCYYGSMIHIGRKHYAAALELLLQALTAPTMVVNAITMAAYKKYALVSLVHAGEVGPLPKHAPTSVTRALKAEAGPYNELAHACTAKPKDDLQPLVAKHAAVFQQDENMGLVKLVLESQVKRNVQRLTQTYLTLSLQDIAQAVNLASAEEAEQVILKMIDAGDVFAQIDQQKGMVRFLEDPEEYCSTAMVAHVDAQIQKAVKLAEKLQAVDHAISSDKAYLSKIHVKERHHRFSEEPADFASESQLSYPFQA